MANASHLKDLLKPVEKKIQKTTILVRERKIARLQRNIKSLLSRAQKAREISERYKTASDKFREEAYKTSSESNVWCQRLENIKSDLAKVDETILQLEQEAILAD
jgi:microcompartment protein CcmL/EutN